MGSREWEDLQAIVWDPQVPGIPQVYGVLGRNVAVPSQVAWGGGPVDTIGPAMKVGLSQDREGYPPGRAGSPLVLEVTCSGPHIQGEMGSAGAVLCFSWRRRQVENLCPDSLLPPREEGGVPSLPAFLKTLSSDLLTLSIVLKKSHILAPLFCCQVNSKVVQVASAEKLLGEHFVG